jgi:hypothetical protein
LAQPGPSAQNPGTQKTIASEYFQIFCILV